MTSGSHRINEDGSRQDKTVILFQAHFINDFVLEGLRRLKAACEDKYDLVLLYDESVTGKPCGHELPVPVFSFDQKTLLRTLPHCPYDERHRIIPTRCRNPFYFAFLKLLGFKTAKERSYRLIPYNIALPLLYFFERHSGYRHYWMIEYDVWYTGDWRLFFEAFENSEADLLTTRLRKYTRYDTSGKWWSTLKRPGLLQFLPLSKKNLVFGFFPLFRLSRRALSHLSRQYRKGWSGYHEVVIPSLLYRSGFKIEDIGGRNEFVLPHNKDRFYRSETFFAGDNPIGFFYSEEKPRLFHPVKNESMLRPEESRQTQS